MKLLLYAGAGKVGKRLKGCIDPMVSDQALEIHRTINSFKQRLCRPVGDIAIAVILADSHQKFNNILNIEKLLEDIKTIIILPDRKNKTVSKVHTLYPRFVSYADSDFKDVSAVIAKILEKYWPHN